MNELYPAELTTPDGRTARAWFDGDDNLVSVEGNSVTIEEAREVIRRCVEDYAE